MADKVITFTSAGACACCAPAGGTLWTWGKNDLGQLGLGDTTDRTSPVQVGTDTDWDTYSCGTNTMAAIKIDGTLWTWGDNTNGQLGLGDTTARNVPTQVGSDTNWAVVAASPNNMLALKTDGTIWSWGANSLGSLGLGIGGFPTFPSFFNTPQQIGTDTDWIYISCYGPSSGAIKSDTSLYTWGFNGTGQLALGDTTARLAPTIVGSGYDKVSMGGSTFALSTGSLSACGLNTAGQLGIGSTTNHTSFVAVGGVWLDISGSGAFSNGIQSGGTLWKCGGGGSSFTQVGSDTDWQAVAIFSGGSRVVLKADGTLWSFGTNSNGNLGLGDTTDRSSPVQIGTDTDWTMAGLSSSNGGAVK